MLRKTTLAALLLALQVGVSHATTFTTVSPTSAGLLPETVSEVGGIVLDLIGNNGVRVVSQLEASALFKGYFNDGTPSLYHGNPGAIGIQTGFSADIISALGGGIQEAAVRITLYDGDTASGDFDVNANLLLLNGNLFGGFSNVNTEATDALGDSTGGSFSGGGFRDSLLDTGFFYNDNAAALESIYDSIVGAGQIAFQLYDYTPYDNYFDFTQGLDGSLIDVGQGPTTITEKSEEQQAPQVPEPTALTLLGLGLALIGARQRRQAHH